MGPTRKTNAELVDEIRRLRAQVAQLEDRLDHVAEHGTAAKALQQSESLHRDVMALVSDTVLMADDAGRLIYVSPNAQFIFGHRPEDIIRQGRVGYVLPGDLFDPNLLDQRGEIANIECQIRDAVGRARNLLVTVRRIDRHGGTTMYVCRDVTERVKIELDYELLSLTLERRVEERTRELRESRERYRRLVEGLRDEYLFYATDLVGTVTYISPSVHNILGYTPDQVIGHNWREFVDPNEPIHLATGGDGTRSSFWDADAANLRTYLLCQRRNAVYGISRYSGARCGWPGHRQRRNWQRCYAAQSCRGGPPPGS